MATQYVFMLHVVAPNGVAQAISDAAFALCPDVGPNNVSTPIVSSDGADDAEPTHFGFSAPVKQSHIDALFGAGLGVTPGVRWWRTDRAGVLQKQWDDETPEPVAFGAADALAAMGLKRRVVAIDFGG